MIHSDEHGRVCRVQYANSAKERIYQRDPLGRVIAITTSDDQGIRTLTAEGDRCFIELEAQKVFLPGKIVIKDSGESNVFPMAIYQSWASFPALHTVTPYARPVKQCASRAYR